MRVFFSRAFHGPCTQLSHLLAPLAARNSTDHITFRDRSLGTSPQPVADRSDHFIDRTIVISFTL